MDKIAVCGTRSPFSNFPTLIPLSTQNQDAFVFQSWQSFISFDKLRERRMALDKHIDVERDIEMTTQIRNALCLCLTASIGE